MKYSLDISVTNKHLNQVYFRHSELPNQFTLHTITILSSARNCASKILVICVPIPFVVLLIDRFSYCVLPCYDFITTQRDVFFISIGIRNEEDSVSSCLKYSAIKSSIGCSSCLNPKISSSKQYVLDLILQILIRELFDSGQFGPRSVCRMI